MSAHFAGARAIVTRGRAIHATSMANTAARQSAPLEPARLLDLVQSSLEDDKAADLVVVDLAEKSSIADYMVIATGSSSRQVSAMADHLRDKLKATGHTNVAIEGAERCDWVLLDAGDIIIHLFRPEVRRFYNLEKMWGLELPKAPSESDPAFSGPDAH